MNDQDIQRVMHIRDEIQEEIKKIGPHTLNLQDATKSLLAQVDVFKALSQTAQEQMNVAIRDASLDMAQTVSDTLSARIETQIQEILATLDQSVQYARRTLDVSKGVKIRNRILLGFAACLFCGIIGAAFGYISAKRHNYTLPPDFIKMYALGHEYKDVLSKTSPQKKQQKIEKRGG